MKILHIINTLHTGGAERLLVDIAPAMLLQGHDVEVVVLNPDKTALMRELVDRGVRVHLVRGLYNEYNPLHILGLIPLMKSFDIVHTHLFPSQYWAAIALGFLPHPPVLVTTEHSTGNSRAKYRLTGWIDKCIYKKYKGIFCISKATEDFMRNRVSDPSVLTQVTNGIQVDRFSHVKANRADLFPDIPLNKKILMQVARFGEQKNQACVIRALKLLPSDYHLVFVGSGIREASCKRLAEEMGLSQQISFLGDRSDVPELLSVADLVIMSSHWEGFGLSAAEAMAAGKVVLASDVPGLSQVVADPEMRFEEDNEADLKNLILKFSDPELRYQKEQWVREWVKQYDVQNTSLQYTRMYEKLLDKKNGQK